MKSRAAEIGYQIMADALVQLIAEDQKTNAEAYELTAEKFRIKESALRKAVPAAQLNLLVIQYLKNPSYEEVK